MISYQDVKDIADRRTNRLKNPTTMIVLSLIFIGAALVMAIIGAVHDFGLTKTVFTINQTGTLTIDGGLTTINNYVIKPDVDPQTTQIIHNTGYLTGIVVSVLIAILLFGIAVVIDNNNKQKYKARLIAYWVEKRELPAENWKPEENKDNG